MSDALTNYLRGGRRRVEGWFERVDAEIYYEILSAQQKDALEGGVAEIGLHHGKSFIALCLGLRENETAYGIDIFDRQEFNKDHSGLGNRAALEANLRLFGIDEGRVVIDARPSQEVACDDILGRAGRIRFFSVDGGHWKEIVINDLALAERCLAPHGVIALDDFLRMEWPEVSAGFFSWIQSSALIPFAMGFNKLYVCHRAYARRYLSALRNSRSLAHYCSKDCEFAGQEVPIYHRLPQTKWNWKTRLREYIKLYHADLYLKLRA